MPWDATAVFCLTVVDMKRVGSITTVVQKTVVAPRTCVPGEERSRRWRGRSGRSGSSAPLRC